jgi:uncharacterized protein (DUF952 family)
MWLKNIGSFPHIYSELNVDAAIRWGTVPDKMSQDV